MMYRLAMAFILLAGLISCKNNEENDDATGTTGRKVFGVQVTETKLPYQLADTSLISNSDTTSIQQSATAFVDDSITKNYFGKNAKIKYIPLARFNGNEGTYFILKATSGAKKAAIVALFDGDNNFLAGYPFLFPDANPGTSQVSVIDKNLTISRNIVERNGAELVGEGKEVVAYDATEKKFSLIMQDPLNENLSEIISPIDTFPKTHRLAGDYRINKKNLVSIRDGRYPNQLLVYIHTENKEGDCTGEMRGEFLLTTSTTATYRQGGDPCVLNLSFKNNTVSIDEQTGCGNYRGLDCPFTGTFTKKTPPSAKPDLEKPRRR
jgi:hypothetical protein